MDLPQEPPQPALAPAPPPPGPLPTYSYFVVVAALYTLLGSAAQFFFLPLGIWWSQLLLFIVPTVLLLRALGFGAASFLRFDRLPARGQRLPVLLIGPAVFFSASALMAACEAVAPRAWVEEFDVGKILDSVHGPWQVVLFAAVVVGAPLAEETVFRGYLLPALRRRTGLPQAIVMQALLFSVIHWDPIGFLPRLLLGVAFGYLVTLTGSIWSSVYAHALNNGVSTVLFFLYGPGAGAEAAPEDPRQALFLFLGAGLAVIALVRWLAAATPEEPPARDPEARGAPLPPVERQRAALLWAGTVAVTLLAFAAASRFGGS